MTYKEVAARAIQEAYLKQTSLLVGWFLLQLLTLTLVSKYSRVSIPEGFAFPRCGEPSLDTLWGKTEAIGWWKWRNLEDKAFVGEDTACNFHPESTSLADANSSMFICYWVLIHIIFLLVQLRHLVHRAAIHVPLLVLATGFVFLNLVHLLSTTASFLLMDHPGYLCATSTNYLIPLRDSEEEQAQALLPQCPVKIQTWDEIFGDELIPSDGHEPFKRALTVNLLPTPTTDTLMTSFIKLNIFHFATIFFSTLIVSVLLFLNREVKHDSSLIRTTKKEIDRDREKIERNVRRCLPVQKILIILFALLFFTSIYLSLMVSKPSGSNSMLVSYLQGTFHATKPPLYKVPPI